MIFEVECDELTNLRTYGLDAHTYCLFYSIRLLYIRLKQPTYDDVHGCVAVGDLLVWVAGVGALICTASVDTDTGHWSPVCSVPG